MPTVRQRMMALLSEGPRGAQELSRALSISEREVYVHLPHIQRTVSAGGRRLAVTPARCLSCGHVFAKRDRLTRPGRCVRCKNERITEPVYQIL